MARKLQKLDLMLREIKDPYIAENFFRIKKYLEELSSGAIEALLGPPGDPSTTFSIPELETDPATPVAGYTWVKKNTTLVQPILSHTLLHFGLTAPGGSVIFDYVLKYKTTSGAVVGVPLT
jgi:hypothetical protein